MSGLTGRLPRFLAKTRLYQPHVFQGSLQKRPYFEGWYFKIVDRTQNLSLCLIPGVAMGGHGDDHAFIQYADSHSGTSGYLRFDLSEVNFSTEKLDLMLGEHQLSDTQIRIKKNQEMPFGLDLDISDPLYYPVRLTHPGIMGPFRFFPAMECYHGVRIVHGRVRGTITMEDRVLTLEDGEIYLEKDWGRSFPREWIWIQASAFESQDHPELPVHLLLSVANIPWMKRSFNGHLGYLWLGDERIPFGTYCGSKVHLSTEEGDMHQSTDVNQPLTLVVNKGDYHIVVIAKPVKPVPLIAPSAGKMIRHMLEDLEAEIFIEVFKNGEAYYSGLARFAGLESCGEYTNLSK